MAKKRKEKTEEDELDFKLPKFDEEKFVKKERRNIRTLLISFSFGLLIGLISFSFWALLSDSVFRWELVMLFGVFNASWIKYIFVRLNIDLTDFGRKGWFGSFATYFFTWLIVLIVLVNPPFYDDEAPAVEIVVLPGVQEVSGTVEIVAYIVDNVDVKKQNINFELTYPDDTMVSPDFTFENNIFRLVYENKDNLTGEFQYKLIASDVNDHSVEKEGTFEYSNDAIKLAEPLGAEEEPGPLVTYSTDLKFDVGSDVSRFFYTVDGGKEINVTKAEDYYETSPKYEGWVKDKNVTVKAFAEVIYYFPNNPTKFSNAIIDSSTYYFNVSDAVEIGGEDPPEVTLPRPYSIGATPGFSVIIGFLAILAVVLIIKYKKKDK